MCWKRKCAAASMPIFFAGSSGEKHYQGTRHSASCHATLPELIIASDLSRKKLWISLITKRIISITPRTLEGSKLRWLDRLLEESWIRGTTADGTTKGSELPVSRARPHMEQLMRPLSVPATARPPDCKEAGGRDRIQTKMALHCCTTRYCLQSRSTCRFFFPTGGGATWQPSDNMNALATSRLHIPIVVCQVFNLNWWPKQPHQQCRDG